MHRGGWRPPSWKGTEGLDADEAELEPVLQDCFADACLDGEEEQLAELLRLRFAFLASQRCLRREVEAEVRKLDERQWDVNGALGQYMGIMSADGFSPSTLLPPWSTADASPSASSSAPQPREVPSPKASTQPAPPPQAFRGANSAPQSPHRGAKSEPQSASCDANNAPQFPSGGANSVPQSPAGASPNGVPRLRRFQPNRTYSSRTAEAHGVSSRPGSPLDGGMSESSTTASSVGSSPVKPSQLRQSIAQHLQRRLQQRQMEWPELRSEKDEEEHLGKGTSSPSEDTKRRRQAEFKSKDDEDLLDDDWYCPPESYSWSSASGTGYTFSPTSETASSTRASAERHQRESGSYAYRFAGSEHRTSANPPSNTPRSQWQPPQSSPSPRPPPGPATYSPGTYRCDGVPNMNLPGMRQRGPGARWGHHATCVPGAKRAAAARPPSSSLPRQQPPPSFKPPPSPKAAPPPWRPPPIAASVTAAARTPVEANALRLLEQRLQELRRVPQAEQRKGCKELLVQWHPDKNPERGEEATRVFQWLQNRRKELGV